MHLLILGANSDVAWATAKRFARETNTHIVLASRNMALLEKKARDLQARYGATARAIAFDAMDTDSHGAFYRDLNPKPDGVILSFGHLGSQQHAQQDFQAARTIIDANFSGAVSIMEVIASDFQQRGAGFMAAISSVAGDRGRQSNYLYGAAKAALTTYLSGLRNRLHHANVRVVTVLPGFIRTKMTQDLNLPALLTATPEQVAEDIYRAVNGNRDIIYTRWFWRWIMFIIRIIPEPIFKRLSL